MKSYNWIKTLKKKINKREKLKKLLGWILQVTVFILIFQTASWWQQKDMLPTNSQSVAPNIVLPNMNGQVLEIDYLSSLNKPDTKKQTLLYFFAPWCTVCHYSVDAIESIKQSGSHSNLQIFMIALDWRSKEEVQNFLNKHELSVPVLLGTQKTSSDFKISGFPSYYLISGDGLVVAKDMGFTTQLGIKSRLIMNN